MKTPNLCVCKQEHLIENEVAVLRRVRHPSIIQLIEVDETPTQLFLVMELVKVSPLLPVFSRKCYYIGNFQLLIEAKTMNWMFFRFQLLLLPLFCRNRETCRKIKKPKNFSITTKVANTPVLLFFLWNTTNVLFSCLCLFRAEICSTPSLPLQSTASETPAPWCSTWLEPSSTCTEWTLYTETSNQRTCWYEHAHIVFTILEFYFAVMFFKFRKDEKTIVKLLF